MSDLDRLLARVVVQDDGCHIWTGAKGRGGYGNFYLRGHYHNTHRAVWLLMRGPIEEGLTIDHLCRVRLCVNVEHMELVTAAENIRRAAKGPWTHCKRGHELVGDALRVFTDRKGVTRRQCQICLDAWFASRRTTSRELVTA